MVKAAITLMLLWAGSLLLAMGCNAAYITLPIYGDRGGFTVWVEGDASAVQLVSVASDPGFDAATVNYLPPSGEVRRAESQAGNGVGEIRVYGAACQLLDQATFGPDATHVQISQAGKLTLKTYGWFNAPPSNTLLLTRTDNTCPSG